MKKSYNPKTLKQLTEPLADEITKDISQIFAEHCMQNEFYLAANLENLYGLISTLKNKLPAFLQSKAAMLNLHQSLRYQLEYIGSSDRVNNVIPDQNNTNASTRWSHIHPTVKQILAPTILTYALFTRSIHGIQYCLKYFNEHEIQIAAYFLTNHSEIIEQFFAWDKVGKNILLDIYVAETKILDLLWFQITPLDLKVKLILELIEYASLIRPTRLKIFESAPPAIQLTQVVLLNLLTLEKQKDFMEICEANNSKIICKLAMMNKDTVVRRYLEIKVSQHEQLTPSVYEALKDLLCGSPLHRYVQRLQPLHNEGDTETLTA